MLRLDLDVSPNNDSNRSNHIVKYIIGILSILLGLLCLAGFIATSITGDVNFKLIKECEHDTQSIALCFLRSLITDALHTQWNRYILVTLLFTYASVFLQIIIESNRTNVSGFLGQMIIQTVFIIIGIGVCFPILFLPSYIYFYYKSKDNSNNKSPVPIDILCIGFIYIICMIIIPTYLIYFLSSYKFITSLMSILLLISPLGFALISLPLRLFSKVIQRCWIINSHRLIVHCQVALFVLSAPLFFITLVSLIMHGSFDLIKRSYMTDITNVINPIAIIWSIDYISLFISLVLFIIIHEYLFHNNNYRIQSLKIRKYIGSFIFALVFLITPCLAFPLYVAWKEYQYLKLI